MIFLIVPLVTILWMVAGQINKLFRPIGIPLSTIGVYCLLVNGVWWYCLPSLLYGFELTNGYGDNSKLMKWLKNDETVRIVYSVMCCLPVMITIAMTQNWSSSFSLLLILLAFQLRLGSWGKLGKYDILADDFFRGISIGLAISLALL